MVFSSILFLFLPTVLTLYFPVRNYPDTRNAVLLIVSFLFYFWGEGFYSLVMITYIVANFFFALVIEGLRNSKQTMALHICIGGALTLNIAALIYYKYAGFLTQNVAGLFGSSVNPGYVQIHLPIGISFFAFQSISYLIDVYRGEVSASRNFLDYSMYKAFFPQLIAGPIVRYRDVSRQLRTHRMCSRAFMHGMYRFCVGLAKKVVLANPMGEIADQIFAFHPADLTAAVAWLGIVTYSLQIYFDFSGYSDMAIGMGRMFGFRFLENFKSPYSAQSIKEFWRRWHISLSTWFRDYLYIPLGGNRVGGLRQGFNLALVFALCGLWHGAQWTFIVWGAWHGLFLILERTAWGRITATAWRPLRHLYTLLVISIGWAFFRAAGMETAWAYIRAMLGTTGGNEPVVKMALFLDHEKVIVCALAIILSTDISAKLRSASRAFVRAGTRVLNISLQCHQKQPYAQLVVYEIFRGVAIVALLFFSTLLLAGRTHNPFIYFRF